MDMNGLFGKDFPNIINCLFKRPQPIDFYNDSDSCLSLGLSLKCGKTLIQSQNVKMQQQPAIAFGERLQLEISKYLFHVGKFTTKYRMTNYNF